MAKLTPETYGQPTIRRLPDEEAVRMMGARSGLIHALIYTRDVIARNNPDAGYWRTPRHHTAKRRAALAKVDVLREVERQINEAQLACAVVLAGHKALAGREALTNPPRGSNHE